MAKKRKSETAPAASPLVRTGSGLADTGPRQSGMAPTSRPYYDADPSTPMFRVVVKANLSMPMADNLIASIAKSFAFLSVHNQIVGASHIFICAQVPRRARRGLQQPPAPRAPAAPQGVLGGVGLVSHLPPSPAPET